MELIEFVFFIVDLDNEDLVVFLTFLAGDNLDEEDILVFFAIKKEDFEDIMQHTNVLCHTSQLLGEWSCKAKHLFIYVKYEMLIDFHCFAVKFVSQW